jgi:BASS family bile acid:Na+ symporter
MEASVLTKIILPLSLFVVMLGMGLSLSLLDFKNTAKTPKPVIIGIIMQLIMLPLVGFAIASSFTMDPILSVGIMAIALCPGGVTSNLYSYLAKGNIALSISLTAVVSLVTPFTIPIILGLSMTHFLGDAKAVELPLAKTILTLIAITVLPVGIGMFIKKKAPTFAAKAEGIVKILSVLALALIVAGITKQNWDVLPGFFAQVGMACLCLCAITMAIGYVGSKLLGTTRKDSVTIGIEVGIQNGTTGLFITSTLLNDPVLSAPPAVYSLLMFGVGAVYAWYFARGAAEQA